MEHGVLMEFQLQNQEQGFSSMAHESREHKFSSGFLYSDFSSNNSTIPQLDSQMQSFEPNSEVFNLQMGMEMLGSRNPISWKGFSSKSGNHGSSSSKNMADTSDFYHSDFQKSDFLGAGFSETQNQNLINAPETGWQENRLLVDDSSLRCVFPGENERPSQGLSLSLSPNKPSNIGLQKYPYGSSNFRDGFVGKSTDFYQHEGRSLPSYSDSFQQLKNSKYLVPAQELLNEFCNLGTKQNGGGFKPKSSKTNRWEEGVSSQSQSQYSLNLLELQKRKAKLVSMLNEVDRRYRQYCEQMRGVVSSFEAVAGDGAATVYSSMASKAMSRHFRWLRDGIVGQIQATKKAMGEKDPVAPGTTRGETPRLKLLDQTIRQQRAFQQMGMIENHPWRPQRGLPDRSVSVLRAWLFEHFLHPYPSDVDKHILARQTGLSRSQVSNWFINARVRLWKPMVEEMYLEETKEQDNRDPAGILGLQDNSRPDPQHSNQNPNPNSNRDSQPRPEDQKPTPEQLVHDSESLSSIILNNKNPDKRNPKAGKGENHHNPHQLLFDKTENFGAIDLDFSSYSHAASTVTYTNSGGHGGESLTLGLQQHGGGGVSLSFSPVSQNSLFFSRQHMEECQPIQYSILDGENQNLPYRNFMGAQLLHDLAG
ncbi:homeobox protein BEL1 homolog [Tasmannia lanceolata]|uniref:homeobox protein BEL1 homolog n=1 Tax=Tasmannia lanceolata TaxID=3420 RepID=UPI0040633061